MINTVKTNGDGFLVNSNMSVPNDPNNTDYQAVQRWIEEGNTPEPEFTQAELDAKEIAETNAAIDAELLALDMASIRDIREYIASKPDAPQLLKDREIEAVAKRGERV